MATTSSCFLFCFVLASFVACMASHIGLGSRLLASQDQAWVSDNYKFAFGHVWGHIHLSGSIDPLK